MVIDLSALRSDGPSAAPGSARDAPGSARGAPPGTRRVPAVASSSDAPDAAAPGSARTAVKLDLTAFRGGPAGAIGPASGSAGPAASSALGGKGEPAAPAETSAPKAPVADTGAPSVPKQSTTPVPWQPKSRQPTPRTRTPRTLAAADESTPAMAPATATTPAVATAAVAASKPLPLPGKATKSAPAAPAKTSGPLQTIERGHTIELDLRAFRGPGPGKAAFKAGIRPVPPLPSLAQNLPDSSPRPRAVSSPSRKTTTDCSDSALDSDLDLSFLYRPTESDVATSLYARSPAVRSRAETEDVVQTKPNVQAMVHAADSRSKAARYADRGGPLKTTASSSGERLGGGESFKMQSVESFQVRMAAAAGANVFAKRVSEGGLLDASGEVDLGALRHSPRPQTGPPSASAGRKPVRESLPVGPAWQGPAAVAAAAAAAADAGTESSAASDAAARGPCYSHYIWAYYCHSGAWSDGMCAGLQNCRLVLSLVCPPLWFWRLYLSLHRSAPLNPGCGDSCRVTRDTASAAAAAALCLMVLGCCIGGVLGGILWQIGAKQNFLIRQKVALFAVVFLPSCYAGGLFWAWLLRAVGEKYNIGQVQRSPRAFLMKACCCICAMNVRVGLHVDRAQGFKKPSRAVRDMVAMAESVGAHVRKSGIVEAPMMSAMRSPSEVLLQDMMDHGVRRTIELDAAQRRTIELGAMRDFSVKPAEP